MPSGPITASTPASGQVGNATCEPGPPVIEVTNLIGGDNVFAVEVHQAAVDGFDVVFGAELIVVAQPAVPELFKLRITPAGPNGMPLLEWTPSGGILQSAPRPEGPWNDTPARSPLGLEPTNAASFYRLRSP
jgi:hypothetical protein